MGKKGIPDRWLDYNSMGRQIPGTRFIAFKVPLKDTLLKSLPTTEDLFDTRAVMDRISNLGMVIDLTNTDRYYDSQDFINNNITYHKLRTKGHILPSKGIFRTFCFLVKNFIEKNKDNEKIIGVHCTHGLNRTGYIICRYMIQQLGVPPDQVISDFGSARGYNIERENYLEDLRKASWPEFVVPKERLSNYFQNSFSSDKEHNQTRREFVVSKERLSNNWQNSLSSGKEHNQTRREFDISKERLSNNWRNSFSSGNELNKTRSKFVESKERLSKNWRNSFSSGNDYSKTKPN